MSRASDQSGASPVKIMLSAGESSGDMHGAALLRAARGRHWNFFGLGGDRLQAEGMRLLAHLRATAVMGVSEVVSSLPRLLAIRARLKRALELERPDVLVLIDSPDFNFALAKHAHKLGVRVVYYICPQVWAWRSGRLKFLARHTHRRALLFPFEKDFYQKRGLQADWVGHPINDELPPARPREELKAELGFEPARKVLAVLPGSRRPVVRRLAPIFLDCCARLLQKDPSLQLALPKADNLELDFLESFIRQASEPVRERLRLLEGQSQKILAAADAAVLASGTSSVEATFLGTPMAVAYQVSPLSWAVAKALISLPYASIANLVAGREIVPEFLQDQATAENLAEALWPMLAGGVARARLVDDLLAVRFKLGGPGASAKVVDIIAEEVAQRRARL